MNKFNVLIAGLVVLVAVTALVEADPNGALQSELGEQEDVDDQLEGGLLSSKAKKIVGVSTENEWGHDILDDNKGLSQFAAQRTRQCVHAKNKEQCHTCCRGSDKASQFKYLSQLLKRRGCTCFDRDNAYARNI